MAAAPPPTVPGSAPPAPSAAAALSGSSPADTGHKQQHECTATRQLTYNTKVT